MHWNPSKLLLLLCLFFAIERFCHWQTDGFRLSKATSKHIYPYSHHSENLPQTLDQPFYYLGKGVQFYVFIGEDQKTILKLFKHHHAGFATDTLNVLFPKFIKNRIIRNREKRMRCIFGSARIADLDIGKETGVTYVHIGKDYWKKKLTKGVLYDKIGIKHSVDFDEIDFVLQERADLVKNRLSELFDLGNIDEAINSMKKVICMVEKRSRKNVKNKDGNILENCGFIGENPVEIDIGSFIHRSRSTHPDPHRKTAFRARLQLLTWVKKKYPQHLTQCRLELLDDSLD